MPVGRKHTTNKSVASTRNQDEAAKTKPQGSVAVTEEIDVQTVPIPQHPLFPDLPPAQGELFFECTLFLYSVLAMFLQYLNLYKTMWWLPNSYTHYALKFHLIDLYLLSCIGLILGRRVTLCFLKKLTLAPLALMEGPLPKYVLIIEWILKLPAMCAIISSFSFSFVQVLSSYPWPSLLYLVYPSLFFIFLFYHDIMMATCDQQSVRGGTTIRSKFFALLAGNFLDSRTQHACSLRASNIREEADILMSDLYQRGKHTVYAAFTTAYFAIFVPCAFAPAALYIDYSWVFEMAIVVFFTSVSLYLAYLLPLQYCNLLHKAAAHLGCWHKIEKLQHGLPFQMWSENDLWTEGCIVKYGRSLYRGEGMCIAAEPGNVDHDRLYMLMKDPVRLINYLCLLQALLILVQFVMLVHSTDWQHVITLVLLMFANYVLLFKLFKDKVIVGRIYNPSRDDDSRRR